MGLDFSRGGAHWSYNGYFHFRQRLNDAVGWITAEDPINDFIWHGDSGALSPEDCAAIAPRLLEVVKAWPDDDYDRQNAEALAAGMLECAAAGVPLEFQ